MRVLVIGKRGQVASELQRSDWPSAFAVSFVGSDRADIGKWRDVARLFAEERPELVVNTAAYTAVDKAETDELAAFSTNAIGPTNLAQACAVDAIPLIHISTDYVYDGTKTEPYTEEDETRPLGVYGRSKLYGDLQVSRFLGQHVILRTSWVFSAFRNNFVKTMLRLGRERDDLRVVGDQFGCPTAAADLAAAIVVISRAIAAGDSPWGLYHFAGRGTTTWHGFAEAIFLASSRISSTVRPPRLERISTAEYPTSAARPANSVLDCQKFDRTFAFPRRAWGDGLTEVLEELLR
jgi:dTDP-4-dehydrorhamnose reductase